MTSSALRSSAESAVATTSRVMGEMRAELASIAATIGDTTARERLTALCDRFATVLQQPAAADDLDVVLAPRETEVLAEVGKGGSNAEIAKHLGLQVTTVKSYLQSAMRKLEATNRVQAVYRARQLGLIT